MKKVFINKCGYTVGVYGCSNEFFNCIAIDGEKIVAFTFKGLYGAENRVEQAFKDKGYEGAYIPLTTYGKLTRKDVKIAHTEYAVIDGIDELLAKGYIEYK